MDWSYLIIAVAVAILGLGLFLLIRRGSKARAFPPEAPKVAEKAPAETAEFLEVPTPQPAPLKERLGKTRSFLGIRLEKFFGKKLEGKEWDELEEILLEADVGFATAQKLLNQTRERLREEGEGSLRQVLRRECLSFFPSTTAPLSLETTKPYVISIVGVNGVGKTTTIGKLAQRFAREGKKVLLGAGDTFRAAAIQQLKIWADRVGSDFVAGREGGDPGAVVFDALTAAKARGADIVLLDTAGRLHTKSGLMDELKKVEKVMKKVIPEAPHQTWLVLDGTLGQNSIAQAKEFQKVLDLTGIIVTKLDGTAKGGALLAVTAELGLPVRYIGVGESADDFLPFDAENFVDAILS